MSEGTARRVALNLGAGRNPIASTPEVRWVNVDRLPLEGIDKQVDLTEYPWIWDDECFDLIYSRHFLEHVPHEPRMSQWAQSEKQWLTYQRLDGFFALFSEIWRCLRPGGTTSHEVPYPLSMEAISDPTHVRFITPQTLSYLCNPETVARDYLLPFFFEEVTLPEFAAAAEWTGTFPEAMAHAHEHWGTLHYWRFELRKAPLPEGHPLLTKHR